MGKTVITESGHGADHDGQGPLLTVDDLYVDIQTREARVEAVKGVSLHVDKGEIVCIVGESGSGKSITALSVMGLLPRRATARGSIRLRGQELLRLTDRQLQLIRGDAIGMIFQDPMSSLNPVMRVGDQIIETLRRHRGLDYKRAKKQAVEMLSRVGIAAASRRVDEYPFQFSGGMQQRAMIALALACEPSLLIADEPTTALDVTVQAQILDLMRKMQQELGMSILLITHDFGVVASMADRVVVMYRGKVVEVGDVDQVMDDPRHDYTKALLNAVPRIDTDRGRAGRPDRNAVAESNGGRT